MVVVWFDFFKILIYLSQETIAQESKKENEHMKILFEEQLAQRTPTRLLRCNTTIPVNKLMLNTEVFEYPSSISSVANLDGNNRQSARVARLKRGSQPNSCVKKSLNGLSFDSSDQLGVVCFPRRDTISMR